jgi:outer membrane receptor protein involved in Fe transport
MRRALLLAAVSPLVFGSPAPAHAAEEGTADGSVSEVVITARKLDMARTGIQTQTGASTYLIGREAIAQAPGGANVALNQVILQAPSVVQDSFGQLHVRGEHNGLQYRLNGVILPEGVSAFGQTLNPRLADKVELITGALPATYGLRTAGIVDITTRDGLENGGEVSLYGGAHRTLHPSLETQGSSGGFNAFVSADWQTSDLGLESPDGRATPLHDRTQQSHVFAYAEQILSPDSRVSGLFGSSTQTFQIPNKSGLQPGSLDGINGLGPVDPSTGNGVLRVNGQSLLPSETLDETQREITHFGTLSFLHSGSAVDYQLSVFGRFSSLYFKPDAIGDLLYDGIAQSAYKRDVAGGLQLEGAWRANAAHTVRGGLAAQIDRSTGDTVSRVLTVDGAGNQTSDSPLTITDATARTARTWSAYLQDEWRLGDALTLNYGLRYDRFEGYVTEDQVSPRINLVWKPLAGTTVHAGYSRYFSPPPFELASNTSIAAFAGTTAQPPGTGNSPPLAERANYYDVGLSQRVGAHLTVGVDSYFKQSRNMIDEGQFGAPIILAVFNYRRGEQWGVEFSGAYASGPFSGYANLALARAVGKDIVSGQFNFDPGDLAYIQNHYIHVDHDQKLTGSAGAAYKLTSRTTVTADLIYGSGLRADGATPNGDHLDPYVVVNAGVSQGLDMGPVKDLTLRLDVINLFDKAYEIRDGSGIGVGAAQFGARRGVFLGLSKRF